MTSTWKPVAFRAMLIVLLAVVAYLPAMRGGFIWDDDDHLTANPAMTAPHGLRMIWSSVAVSRYYPLTLTSFWVQHRLWGLHPMPYHAVNIAFHALNGVLVFLVLRRLQVPAAWLAAALWVVHPVTVESVAWITELKNTQSGFFFFCAVLCFLRFEAQEQCPWYALALLCGAAALLSKASTVILPLALLSCVWWERGHWRWTDIKRILTFLAMALLMSALAIVEQRRHVALQGTSDWSIGIGERAIISGKALWFYAAKILWPVNLAFVYPRWEVAASSIRSWLPLVGALAVGFALWMRRQQPWARAGLFGLGFFVAALLPVLGFVDVFYFRYSFVADHFQYLASLGVIAYVASGIVYVFDRSKLWSTPVCSLLMVTMVGLTWRQSQVYHSNETLWRDTVTKSPASWMAHNNLGIVLQNLGQQTEAETQYKEALRLKPDYVEAHNNLGFSFSEAGKLDEAIAQYEQALRADPEDVEALNNLGNALSQTGRPEEAIAQFEKALHIKPGYIDARNNLGAALLRQGRIQNAIEQWERVLQAKPDYANAHNNLGVALARSGKIQEAIEQWELALRINPDYSDAHYNMGIALEQAGKLTEAREHWEQALRIRPDYADAQNRLARLRDVR